MSGYAQTFDWHRNVLNYIIVIELYFMCVISEDQY